MSSCSSAQMLPRMRRINPFTDDPGPHERLFDNLAGSYVRTLLEDTDVDRAEAQARDKANSEAMLQERPTVVRARQTQLHSVVAPAPVTRTPSPLLHQPR
jgi:hypothetical protein